MYYLPENISGLLDLETLERDTDSYIAPAMSSTYADVVYSCLLKKKEGKQQPIETVLAVIKKLEEKEQS